MDGKLSEKHEKHEENSEWHQKGGDSSTSWQRVMKVTKRTETKMSSKTEQKTRTYKVIDLTGLYTTFFDINKIMAYSKLIIPKQLQPTYEFQFYIFIIQPFQHYYIIIGDEKKTIDCKEDDDDMKPKLDSSQFVESTITIKADGNPGSNNPNTKMVNKESNEEDEKPTNDVPENVPSGNQNKKSNRTSSCCPACQKCSKCCKPCTIL